MNTKTIETTSRKLEQFLYLHGIKHTRWYKDQDGMTVWVYEYTKETARVVDEYRQIIVRRNG